VCVCVCVCVCDLETSTIRRPMPHWGCCSTEKKIQHKSLRLFTWSLSIFCNMKTSTFETVSFLFGGMQDVKVSSMLPNLK
jgi:hypothetical protein